ncbi:nuclease-related domain-containing protein [Cytobacillus sp. FJAT-54145]|uniref:Nuclease-related domain-containing protein n=1 Tax=Cytobacillus spartinae TaxID=3299023 RepID=A0ABW6K8Z6_9BACI
MIIKPKRVPLFLRKLRALQKRLPQNHPKLPLILEELSKREAGYKGESSLDYHLSFLDPNQYFIFHDLRLRFQTHYFQMDILIVSRSFIVILEVKNIAGSLFFDTIFNQLIRTKDGVETAFQDPLIQIQRQESNLKNWLLNKQIPDMPIFSLVVISNPHTIIRTPPKYHYLNYKIIRPEIISNKINHFEITSEEVILTEKELKKLAKMINKEDTVLDSPILERFQIDSSELRKGVFCNSCGFLPMIRTHGSWYCPSCKTYCKNGHLQALNDYRLLVSNEITNMEMRKFLIISSRANTTRLLQSMNLSFIGNNKGRIYQLPYFNDSK